MLSAFYICSFLFLSTPSVRRATQLDSSSVSYTVISIHALREEGDCILVCDFGYCPISIHALREEGDRPAGGTDQRGAISIHALREEGDL